MHCSDISHLKNSTFQKFVKDTVIIYNFHGISSCEISFVYFTSPKNLSKNKLSDNLKTITLCTFKLLVIPTKMVNKEYPTRKIIIHRMPKQDRTKPFVFTQEMEK